MLKKIWNSKYLSWGLDAVGIFSLASFIMLGFFLRFIVDILPSCYFTDALIVYVECGTGFTGGFLKFYFQFFSPLIAWIVPLMVYSLVVSAATLRIIQFFTSLLFCGVILLAIIMSFRMIYRISKRLLWRRSAYSPKERHMALAILLLALSPSILAWTVKYQIRPPQSSSKIITVDMWHSTFSIPRHYLNNWALTEIKRPSKQSSAFENISRRGKTSYPFASIDILYSKIDSSAAGNEKTRVSVSPHYNQMSETELYQKREEYLEGKKKRTARKELMYAPAKNMGGWEVYEPEHTVVFEPDIFIHRNDQGNIENILECTPKTHCAKRISLSGWSLPKCKNDTKCLDCTRMCKERSFGTQTLNVSYSFDKKYLDRYFDRHDKIINFIESHSTPKEAARFSFTGSNISSWRDVNMGLSIRLTESGKLELFEMTQQNVGKPMAMYVEDHLVSSPIVMEPIGSGSAMLAVDDEMKQKIIPLLPAKKIEK